ncbi:MULTISPECIES: transposase [Laspinema]|uniref:transposase n=1 Tax=Laspinema TaxID=2584823 RepID=UPI0021BA7165|nr:transposase [Laspinema sp. D3c]MCT7960944.1 transposase [Laspinema sp. D2b]MCT7996592.1 transposase [Laspinema sp. D3c]
MLDAIFARFVEHSPVSVMMRALMERTFSPDSIEEIFQKNSEVQYTRDLLFSTVVNLMSLVVCGIHPSVNAAYKAKAVKLNVSRTSVYNKLNGVETAVSEALLRDTCVPLVSLIQSWRDSSIGLVPGMKVRILDGNCLAGTDHRLDVLKGQGAKVLPGKSLVVLDPDLDLAINVFLCEDGHAQERRLFSQVLETVEPNELWIADRNMCTRDFLLGLNKKGAYFVIREHQTMPWEPVSELKSIGKIDTGLLLEQSVKITNGAENLVMRRVLLRLFKPTQSGEKEIAIFTTLSSRQASTGQVTHLYRNRRTIENLFQVVTENYQCEIKALGYPKAALFSFCLALIAYNILATVRAALATVHGSGKIEAGLSSYYMVEEMQGVYRGMMIAIEPVHWEVFDSLPLTEFGDVLLFLSHQVRLLNFIKQPRGPKKKKAPPIYDPKHPHLSTARLLEPSHNSP